MALNATALTELTNRVWPSLETAEADLAAASAAAGFATTRRRSENRDYLGNPRRYVYECYRSRTTGRDASNPWIKGSGSTGKTRSISSAKISCPWMCALIKPAVGDNWHFRLVSDRQYHNHELLLADEAIRLAPHQRRVLAAAHEAIVNAAADPDLSAAHIIDLIQRDFPEARFQRYHIHNTLRRERIAKYGDRSNTQQFLHSLEANASTWFKIFRGDDDRIERVFWTYTWCIELWQQNPEILSIDNTYKVNRFNMPLCQISGISAFGTTFPVAWCLLSGEKEESFSWVLQQLQTCGIEHGGLSAAAMASSNQATPGWVHEPCVIISDFDKAFKRAARAVYPTTVKHQLCRWHILKNVRHNIKKKWIGTLDGTLIGQQGGGQGSRDPEPDPDGAAVEDIGTDAAAVAMGQLSVEHPDEDIHDLEAEAFVSEYLQQDEWEEWEEWPIATQLEAQLEAQLPPPVASPAIPTIPALPVKISVQYPGARPITVAVTPVPILLPANRQYKDSADGIWDAWKHCVAAKTQVDFKATWQLLNLEFSHQLPIINYLQSTYLPYLSEFAEYAVCSHRNYGL